ncbi:hypothetical protein CYMTET_6017 [Cymbomonas tetramitiformis]|uniref:F-box/LRR-repeat protein 15-like leucin rich repeat domain-containing protein n=1 Tax=Cymbomonas tetramitiformis TaxID=36881 RepID=A0AAE0GZZ0_9CHLO|nr:hypothetical protein CYMTET_6017 [Cymbomonas tetramitiformis]
MSESDLACRSVASSNPFPSKLEVPFGSLFPTGVEEIEFTEPRDGPHVNSAVVTLTRPEELNVMDLPDGTLLQILTIVKEERPSAFATLRRVCWKWRCAVDERLFTTLSPNSLSVSKLQGRFTSIRSLSLSKCTPGVTNQALADLAQSGMNITDLNLSLCRLIDSNGIRALRNLTTLSTLDLAGCRKLNSEGIQAVTSLPSLTTLALFGCSASDSLLGELATSSSLTSLNLGRLRQVTADGLTRICTLTRLKSLLIRKWPNLADEDLMRCAVLSNLCMLDISDCRAITDAGVKALAPLTLLLDLDLSGCTQVTQGACAALGALTNLRSLELGGCFEVCDRGAAHLTSLTGLETLGISGLPRLTPCSLWHVAALRSLTSLDLAMCPQVHGLRASLWLSST